VDRGIEPEAVPPPLARWRATVLLARASYGWDCPREGRPARCRLMRSVPDILNWELSRAIVALGHGDLMIVCDAGLPLGRSTGIIDLALVPGVPSFLEVLSAISAVCSIDAGLVATELRSERPELHEQVHKLLLPAPLNYTPHKAFKEQIQNAAVIVRSGECSPFANIGLYGGVVFR
jgi:D-ribose pyranase